jgi:hypothetical protein
MARGKQKGHQKTMMTIKDKVIAPYYITLDESQYTLMTEGSTLPVGYFSNLGIALKRVSRLLTVNESNQDTVNLSEYISRYEQITQQVNEVVNI